MTIKNDSKLLEADAMAIATLISSKEISCEDCIHIFMQQITTVNPILNAVVEDRFQEALEEAKQKDKLIQEDKVSFQEQPLFGVPVSIKEAIDVKGMKTTGGLHYRSDLMMSDDAPAVRSLKEAGAIILCKTNTPSLSFCHETDNKLYGRTNNAWNTTLSAGGSSGGEAALIATGASPLGLASDIGGSIRLPSHFNGVVGFKPGKFRVDTSGHFPTPSIPLQRRMLTIGPIGKSVRDVQLAYQLIAVPTGKKILYEKMHIDILPSDNGLPISSETAAIMNKVKNTLEATNQVNLSIPPYFNDSAHIWQEIMSIDGGKEMRRLAYNTDRPNVFRSYMREKMTGKTTTHLYLSWALLGASLFKPNKKRMQDISLFMKEGDHILDNHLNNRILIFPVYHTFALPHGQVFKEVFSIHKTYEKFMPYLAYANLWGLPSLTIPIVLENDHMPIGIQIIGKSGNEDAIFKIGQELENRLGGFRRSTLYDKVKL